MKRRRILGIVVRYKRILIAEPGQPQGVWYWMAATKRRKAFHRIRRNAIQQALLLHGIDFEDS
jgi:hypothetical protein